MLGSRQCLAFSKAFLGRFSVNEYAGQALGGMIELQVLLEPLQAANELRFKGEELAFSSGDIVSPAVFLLSCLFQLHCYS